MVATTPFADLCGACSDECARDHPPGRGPCDPVFFALVTVDPESGTVTWPGGIDLAPEPLYAQAHAHPLVAA
jgi:uncharacterized protein DUF2442